MDDLTGADSDSLKAMQVSSTSAEWYAFGANTGCLDAGGRWYRRYVLVSQNFASCKSLADARASSARGFHYLPAYSHCHLLVDKDVVLTEVGSHMHSRLRRISGIKPSHVSRIMHNSNFYNDVALSWATYWRAGS